MTDFQKILKAVVFSPGTKGNWGLPVLFTGKRGSSKTTQVRQFAARSGLPVYVLAPGHKGPGAFGVVPFMHASGEYLWHPPPEFAVKLGKSPSLLFIDELLTAPSLVRPALLGLIDERMMGDCFLGKQSRVLGATNAAGETAGGAAELDSAVANRLLHLAWPDPTAAEVANFLVSGSHWDEIQQEFDPVAEETRVLGLWPNARAKNAGLVSSFLRANPSALREDLPEGNPRASGAHATPRTWEMAVCALAGSEVHGLDTEETDSLFEGCVGAAINVQFSQFRRAVDLPDPTLLLDGKVSFTHTMERLDRTCAVLDACEALLASGLKGKEKDRKKDPVAAARAEVLWKIIFEVFPTAPDVAEAAGGKIAGLRFLPSGEKARNLLSKFRTFQVSAEAL